VFYDLKVEAESMKMKIKGYLEQGELSEAIREGF
jgi:hypothetical protein